MFFFSLLPHRPAKTQILTAHLKELIQSSMAVSMRKTYGAGTQKFCDRHHACRLPARKETSIFYSCYDWRANSIHNKGCVLNIDAQNSWLLRSNPSQNLYWKEPSVSTHSNQLGRESLSQYNSSQVTLPDQALQQYAGSCILHSYEWASLPFLHFDPRILTTNTSIHFSRNHYIFHLSRSKTDQYGHGYDIYIYHKLLGNYAHLQPW